MAVAGEVKNDVSTYVPQSPLLVAKFYRTRMVTCGRYRCSWVDLIVDTMQNTTSG